MDCSDAVCETVKVVVLNCITIFKKDPCKQTVTCLLEKDSFELPCPSAEQNVCCNLTETADLCQPQRCDNEETQPPVLPWPFTNSPFQIRTSSLDPYSSRTPLDLHNAAGDHPLLTTETIPGRWSNTSFLVGMLTVLLIISVLLVFVLLQKRGNNLCQMLCREKTPKCRTWSRQDVELQTTEMIK